ncbi:MAG: hypothetical protein HY905_15805 [Deltaproteobacteria bacterium]|nr:hypothetical protein [Deltaproteobacteria bacterium]
MDRLENPTPFQYAKGDQKHFLGRLERLEAEPRGLALRPYYHGSLRRGAWHLAPPSFLLARRLCPELRP